MFANWNCRRVGGLLIPYNEGALGDRERARVATHVARCAACREELNALSAMADLLRANPPAAAAPAADLWSRIESQITPTAPVPTPVPAPARASAASQWRGFWLSFGSSGVAVAAVVTGITFFVNGRHASRPLPERASAPAAPRMADAAPEVEIRFLPPSKARSVAAAPATTAAPSPRPDARARVAAASRPHRRRGRRVREAAPDGIVLALIAPRRDASETRVATAASPRPRPLPLKAAPARVLVATAPRVGARFAPPLADAADSVAAPRTESAAAAPLEDPGSVPAFRPRATMMVASAATFRTAAARPMDEVLEREVPASVSPAEVGTQLRRQQSLFSYAR